MPSCAPPHKPKGICMAKKAKKAAKKKARKKK